MRYTIIIDDDERDNDPGAPWTAMLADPDGFRFGDAGYGGTPQEAVKRLLDSLT